MRIRTIKPEFFRHSQLYLAEKETGLPLRLAYIGLWCEADREGRFKWQPMEIGVTIFPFDGVDFSRVLDALRTRGFLVKYRVNDEWYGLIPSFPRHQVINNRERASVLPSISEAQELLQVDLTRDARVEHAALGEGKGREGKGTEGKGVQGETTIAPKKQKAPLTPEEIISKFSKDPTYTGIDVRREFGKMTAWCQTRRKVASERRFVNWLNNAERPLVGSRNSLPVNGVNHVLINAENWQKQEEHAARVKAERERAAKLSAELDRKMKELEEQP